MFEVATATKSSNQKLDLVIRVFLQLQPKVLPLPLRVVLEHLLKMLQLLAEPLHLVVIVAVEAPEVHRLIQRVAVEPVVHQTHQRLEYQSHVGDPHER